MPVCPLAIGYTVGGQDFLHDFPFMVDRCGGTFELFSIVTVLYPVIEVWRGDVYRALVACHIVDGSEVLTCDMWLYALPVDHVYIEVVYGCLPDA